MAEKVVEMIWQSSKDKRVDRTIHEGIYAAILV